MIFVISGPSGVGKGTVVKELLKINKNLKLSVSCTTRLPREGEIDAVDYHFISQKEFFELIKEKAFLEYAKVNNYYYGTLLDFIKKEKNSPLILELDINGGLNVKHMYKDAVLIFLKPPTYESLRDRLLKRGTEAGGELENRLKLAKLEMEFAKEYDYMVLNDDLNLTVQIVNFIIEENLKKKKEGR